MVCGIFALKLWYSPNSAKPRMRDDVVKLLMVIELILLKKKKIRTKSILNERNQKLCNENAYLGGANLPLQNFHIDHRICPWIHSIQINVSPNYHTEPKKKNEGKN